MKSICKPFKKMVGHDDVKCSDGEQRDCVEDKGPTKDNNLHFKKIMK